MLYLGELRGTINEDEAKRLAQDLAELPLKIEQLLNDADLIEELSKDFFRVQDFLYLGRGINFPVALEGALKLKEISYIHAEGYPAGEMKHGPNALIDEAAGRCGQYTRERTRESELHEENALEHVEVRHATASSSPLLTGGRMSSEGR